MLTHSVHLYERLGSSISEINFNSENCFPLDFLPVVALLDNTSVEVPSRKKLVERLNLKPFEILQDHFDLFIKAAEKLKVQIMDIKFTEEIDQELEEDLNESIGNKDYKKVYSFVKEVRLEDIDIFSLTYIHDSISYTITKYAVAEFIGDSNKIPEIIIQSPLSFIAGLKKFPSSLFN
ncbi:hypothetical protein MOE20_06520 [Bacillus atrophaeus]|uniref:hypothetical protein n=1 Tax=Bacillus atrophaeus TaxID=1452 RepID=UPI002280D27E|nr:hypothetical protein [Bacillus atrophaeus]MCY8915673.1 hypothetical protein [Bacillus atrophaeus]MCY8924286.1 hypothetical protein [Bacillus atrophaeus]